jgi:hypothetical protein
VLTSTIVDFQRLTNNVNVEEKGIFTARRPTSAGGPNRRVINQTCHRKQRMVGVNSDQTVTTEKVTVETKKQ